MDNISRSMLLNGDYKPSPKFSVPLVSSLHPATTVLSKLVREKFADASIMDSKLDFLFPKSSLLVAYRRLPNLQLLLCKNDQKDWPLFNHHHLFMVTLTMGATVMSAKPPLSQNLFPHHQCLGTVWRYQRILPVSLDLLLSIILSANQTERSVSWLTMLVEHLPLSPTGKPWHLDGLTIKAITNRGKSSVPWLPIYSTFIKEKTQRNLSSFKSYNMPHLLRKQRLWSFGGQEDCFPSGQLA